ncbi:MAG: hypothetical protein SFV51_08300, partial [Bryobacteraceae bacterium]|nr:hypothetical protein [Bryobacteraceae bacterium]
SLFMWRFPEGLAGRVCPAGRKQHLAALRMLFDWLVTGQVIAINPAHAVRGPKHVVTKGKTPVLNPDEPARCFDSVPLRKIVRLPDGGEQDTPHSARLRARALIGLMVYTFARMNAVLQTKVSDLLRVGPPRLGAPPRAGNHHELPYHHNLEQYLDETLKKGSPWRRRRQLCDSVLAIFANHGTLRMDTTNRQGARHANPQRKSDRRTRWLRLGQGQERAL